MRILVFNWRDITHPWAGGAEVNIHEQAKRWVQAGHDVTLFCGAYQGSSHTATIDGVRIIRKGGRFGVYVWAAVYYLTRFRSRYDVIVDLENGIPFFTPLYSRLPKVCLFHHLHTEQYRYEFRPPVSWLGILAESALMPLVYRKVPFVTISESSREALLRIGVAPERCAICYCGIDTHEYTPAREKETKPVFVHVGRLMAYKRVDLLLRLMARIVDVHPEAELHIAGSGPMEQSLRRLSAQLGLQNHVVFHGYVTQQQKVALLRRAWALVTASSREGWGLVAIEANACGTPAIAFAVDGLSEAIQDGRSGVLACTEDEYVRAMLRIIEDRRFREVLSRTSIEHAKRFDWNATSQTMLRVLESQLTAGQRGHSVEAQTVEQRALRGQTMVKAQLPSRRWP